jgi:hypothetical protein
MSNQRKDFDQVAVVIDWLDACRHRDIEALLDLYALDASLQCECDKLKFCRGRTQLQEYWRSRLDAVSPNAFALQEIAPCSGGVELDYIGHEGKPVRVFFAFTDDGKIMQTSCGPAAQANRRDLGVQPIAGAPHTPTGKRQRM